MVGSRKRARKVDKVLSFTVSVHFAPADISRQQLSHRANMDTSGAPPIQSKSTSSTATSGAEKSKSKRVEEPVGKSASNTPERAAHDESYNYRIGVVACVKSIDLSVSQDPSAGTVRKVGTWTAVAELPILLSVSTPV